jgi:hypothetical protein
MGQRTFTNLVDYDAWLKGEGAVVQVHAIVFEEGRVIVTYNEAASVQLKPRQP